MTQSIKVKSPATVANLSCGFDVLGLALGAPFDEYTVTMTDDDKGNISIENADDFGLPIASEKNVSGIALMSMIRHLDRTPSFHIISNKKIKPGSGIGSSASSAAGVVVAANHLLGKVFSKKQLVDFAMDGEALAGGSRHADNVAPAIFGGITLVRSADPLDIISLSYPTLYVTILHPQIEVKTSDARAVLPKEIGLKTATMQWGNVGALVAAFAQSDYQLIARSLVDLVAEPARAGLIPYFYQTKEAGIAAGALGGGISGSGPSIFMLSATESVAQNVESAMMKAYMSSGIAFHTYTSQIDREGVSIIE